MIILVELFIVIVSAVNAVLYRGTITGWLSAIAVALWIVVFVLAKFYDDNDDEG